MTKITPNTVMGNAYLSTGSLADALGITGRNLKKTLYVHRVLIIQAHDVIHTLGIDLDVKIDSNMLPATREMGYVAYPWRVEDANGNILFMSPRRWDASGVESTLECK